MRDKLNKKAALVILVAILIIAVAGCDCGEYVTVNVDWTIYQKTYIPATQGTPGRWGYSFAGDGGFVYMKGEKGTEERYEFLLVRDEDGREKEAKTVEVSQVEYATYEVGDTYTTEEWEWVPKEEGTE